jgi:hypothetical protein
MACFQVLVARDTCLEREDRMKKAVFLATTALLAMLILMPLMPMATAQYADAGTTLFAGGGGDGSPSASDVSAFPPLTPETGGSAILLPAATLLLGSGILTYAILRRR